MLTPQGSQKYLRKRQDWLFTFMDYEGVPWHNNDAERAIRQGALHRKISGGRRTWAGAEVFEVILSTYETAKTCGDRFIEMVRAKFDPPAGARGCGVGASYRWVVTDYFLFRQLC